MSKSIPKPYQIANEIWNTLQSGYDYSSGESYRFGEVEGIYYFGIRGEREIQFFSDKFALAYQTVEVAIGPLNENNMRKFVTWAIKYAEACPFIESFECVAMLPPYETNDYELHEVYVIRMTNEEDTQHD